MMVPRCGSMGVSSALLRPQTAYPAVCCAPSAASSLNTKHIQRGAAYIARGNAQKPPRSSFLVGIGVNFPRKHGPEGFKVAFSSGSAHDGRHEGLFRVISKWIDGSTGSWRGQDNQKIKSASPWRRRHDRDLE